MSTECIKCLLSRQQQNQGQEKKVFADQPHVNVSFTEIAVFGSAFFDFLSKPAFENWRLCYYLNLPSVLMITSGQLEVEA